MSRELTPNQEFVVEELSRGPKTSKQLAEKLEATTSYIRDIVAALRRYGYDIENTSDGRYAMAGAPDDNMPSNVENTRIPSRAKSSITREVKDTLAEMETRLTQELNEMEPARADGGHDFREQNHDLIIHRTDDHFGEVVTNQHGEETFNSDIAEDRVREVFDRSLAKADERRAAGIEFDNAHLLIGGDVVTNEAIYDGQPHDIDETLHQQINRAADVYIDGIKRLSDEFPAVQVVCQPGNHGRIGSGQPTNADSIFYSMLDKVIRESDRDNITVLQSDRSYYIDFKIREWNAHLRHGHDKSLEHIGTSAGKQRWLSWLVDHGFDIAFRGHYHMLKEEPVNGVPVHMGGSIIPQTEFEESQAISGRAAGAVHGATDRAPDEWTERIYFE